MGLFFAELKRRNVFKVGVAYTIVAWLLIQVASIIVPAYQAPGWVMPIFVTLVFLGFPIAIFLAWVYELTPEGIKVTTSEGPAQFHTQATGQRLNYFILGVLVLVVAFIVLDNYVLVGESDTASSVANSGAALNTVVETTAATIVSSSLKVTPSTTRQVHRHNQMLGRTQPMPNGTLNAYVALSPVSNRLVYGISAEGTPQIYVRELDTLTTNALPHTEDVNNIFVSPDGEWVGFTTTGDLYKISILGGFPQRLIEGSANNNRGGIWAADGMIYFVSNQKLHRIAANGGKPEQVNINSDLTELNQTWPSGLPGNTHLLLTVSRPFSLESADIALLSLTTGDTEILLHNAYHARYVPTGHIVFMRSGSLWAVPFNVVTMTTTGPEVPVVNGVQSSSFYGKAVYTFSDDGMLVYLPGRDAQTRSGSERSQLVWVDRQGKQTPLAVKADFYSFPRLSPDATQIAVVIGNEDNADIWTYDINRNIMSRRTFSGDAHSLLWTPDGSRLLYSFYPNYQGMAWVKADGTGQPEKLIDAPRVLHPTTFMPDGSQLLYFEALKGPNKVYALTMTGERNEQPILTTEFNERNPSLSPDGRWLAYESNETGQYEIYVRPYPNVDDGHWQISTNGGEEPHWRGDGKELFYRQGQNPETMMAVPVETGERFQYGTATRLFRGNYTVHVSSISYDVNADGQRFLMLKQAQETNNEGEAVSRETNLIVVENWFEELKRLAPPAN